MQTKRDWIQLIAEDMDVYDIDGDKVGEVESFRFGTEGDAEPMHDYDNDSLIENLAEAFGAGEFPEEVHERLLQEGFIRIDKGILQGYGYVPNSSIRSVEDGNVYLNIERDGILVPR